MEDAHGKGSGGQKLVARPCQKPWLKFGHEAGGPHSLFQVRTVMAQVRMMGQVRNDPVRCLRAMRCLGNGKAHKTAGPQNAIQF